jgi:hypothetical protein
MTWAQTYSNRVGVALHPSTTGTIDRTQTLSRVDPYYVLSACNTHPTRRSQDTQHTHYLYQSKTTWIHYSGTYVPHSGTLTLLPPRILPEF